MRGYGEGRQGATDFARLEGEQHSAKAVAAMQACAVHLRDRSPNLPRARTLLVWTAVAK